MPSPIVSILLVVRNEKDYLRNCIDSLIRQDYPHHCLEFLFIDGCSEDGTYVFLAREVEELVQRGYAARLLINEKRILASGWNLGIKEAHGDYVCRIDAHSEISSSYVSMGIRSLLMSENARVAAVGGWLRHAAKTPTGRLVAMLMSSKFAVGDSPFRQRPVSVCNTDTAVYGIYRRSVFSEVGYFDEKLSRNQDMVLHHRLKTADYTFLTHPEMEITYYVRSTIRRLMTKAFGDGKWVALAGGEHFCLRHKVPLLFVLYLSVFIVTYIVSSLLLKSIVGRIAIAIAVLPLIGYGILSILFAMKIPGTLIKRLLLSSLFFPFHVAYGAGTFWGYCQVLLYQVVLKNDSEYQVSRSRSLRTIAHLHAVDFKLKNAAKYGWRHVRRIGLRCHTQEKQGQKI